MRAVAFTAILAMILAVSAGIMLWRTAGPIYGQAETPAPVMAGSWQDVGNFDIEWGRIDPTLPGGTAANPWLISTPRQMAGMANRLNANQPSGIRTQHFRVTADMDLRAHAWVPITTFSGVFDGGMHTFQVPPTIGRGLFTHVTGAAAAVRNMIITGDVAVRIAGATTAPPASAGVLTAQLNGATIENIINHANLTVTVASNRTHIGGIIGSDAAVSPANALIRNLVNFGNISVSGATTGTPRMEVAGIMSNAWMSIRAYNLANYGNIQSTVANTVAMGGLFAQFSGGGGGGVRHITNSYNAGNISANTLLSSAAWRNVGGITGGWTPNTNNSAGFVLDGVYNLGTVTAPRATQLVRVEGTTGTGGRRITNTFSMATTLAGKNSGSAVTRTGRHGTITANGEVTGWLSGTNPAPYGTAVPLNLTAQMQNVQQSFTGVNADLSVPWVPSVDNANIPVLAIDNVRLNFASDLFRINAQPGHFRMNHGNNIIPFPSSEHQDYLQSRGIRFLGWARTQARANEGTIDFAPDGVISIEAEDYQFNRLFAVYEFSFDRTITVQRGDGVLAPINAATTFTSRIRRPGQFLAPNGNTFVTPYFAPFALIPSAVNSGMEHIGWADSLTEARLGQVNDFPLDPSIDDQPHLFENTRIYAVWQRTDAASLQMRFNIDALAVAGSIGEEWFNTAFPTITETFTTAQRTFNLTGFAPATAVPYNMFVGWATTLTRAQAGIIDHLPNAVITIPYPNQAVTPLYAVWEPIRLTLFVNSVFNTGISPTPQFSYETAMPSRSLVGIQVASGGYNRTLAANSTQITHGGATFLFRGWASNLERAINGQADFLGTGNPTTVNVNRNVELHAVWQLISGTPLPPVEGTPPIDPPVDGMNRLPAPLNVDVNQVAGEYILSWNDVDNAMGFRVYINGHPTIFFPNVPYAITSINLSMFYFPIPMGQTYFNFHLQVRAIGNNITYTHSLLSARTVFRVDDNNYNPGGENLPNVDDDEDIFDDDWNDEQGYTQLTPPTNVQISSSGILTWTGVDDSSGYRIYVDGVFRILVPLGTSFDLTTLGLAVGTYSVTVVANGSGNFVTSNHSAPASFEVDAASVSWTFVWTASHGGFSGSGGAGSALPEITPSQPGVPSAPQLIEAGGSWIWDGWEVDAVNRRFVGVFTWVPPEVGAPEPTQLGEPMYVRVNNDDGVYVLLWNEVENAYGYRIYINGKVWYTTSNTAVILEDFPEGQFEIRVRALAPAGDDFSDSDLSEALIIRVYIDDDEKEIIIVDPYDPDIITPPPLPPELELPPDIPTPPAPPPPIGEPVRLGTPSNVRVADAGCYVLMWDAVANAYAYRIYINGAIWYTTNNTAVILEDFWSGSFVIRIRAIAPAGGNFLDSELSTALTIMVYYCDEDGEDDRERIVIVDPNNPDITTPPVQLPPEVELPPEVTTPPAPTGDPVRLRTPSNVRVYNNDGEYVLTWNAVANAYRYRIYINGVVWYTTSNNAVILRDFPEGDFEMRIRAIAPTGNDRFLDSELSVALTIRVYVDDEDEGGNEIVIVNPNNPSITTPPAQLPPDVTLPPDISTPPPPPSQNIMTGGRGFTQFMRDYWFWVLLGCLITLLIIALLLILIIAKVRSGKAAASVVVTGMGAGAAAAATDTFDPKAKCYADIAECRAKLQYAATLVSAHEVAPVNAELEKSARLSLKSAEESLEKAIRCVAKYKKKYGSVT